MPDNQASPMSAAEAVASSAASEMMASAMPFGASTGSRISPDNIAQFVGEAFSAVDDHLKELGLDESQIATVKEKVVTAAQQKATSAEEVGSVGFASEIGPPEMTASELVAAAEFLATAAESTPNPKIMASSEMSLGMPTAAELTEATGHLRRWHDDLSSVLNSL